MDARAVCQVAGIEVGTLNVWVQRGLIPGMNVGARGRQRNFALETATHILIMAELVRLGFGAPAASNWARVCFYPYLLVSITGRIDLSLERFRLLGFDSEAELPQLLEKEFPEGRPNAYVVINAEGLRALMRQAHEEWERSHKGEGS